MQDYESSVAFLGTWGPFQRRIFFLLCFTTIPSGYNLLSVFFLLASPPHHCHIPVHSNMSQASIPVQQVNGQPERSRCSRYELDMVQNLSVLGSSPDVVLSSLKQESCRDGWTYSTENYQSTVVTEFNLVCSDQWKQPLTSLAYFLGGLLGCLISGQMSDRFGRKPVLFGSISILTVFSIAVAFAPSWPIFIVLYLIMGMGQIASFVILFVLGSEILLGSTRVLYSTLCLPTFWVIGMLLLPGTAYLVRNWRHLSLIMAVPGLACIPLWWQVPESPRWLMSRGRQQEAEHLLLSAALENKVELPKVIFSVSHEKTKIQKSASFLDLLRTPNIRRNTLKMWIIWFSLSVSYFGLSFNMSSLNGNPFLNYFLVTVVEVPAYGLSWLAVRNYPRRLPFVCFTLLAALALLLIQITLHSQPTLTLFLVILGKFGVLIGIAVSYVHTGELFPTVIRNTAMSSCATFSRMGCCVSPYLLELAVFYEFLPWIIAGSLSLLSVMLYIFLPETFRQPLPDTIQDLHDKGTKWFRWPWASTLPPKDDRNSAKEQTTGPAIICTTSL